MTMTQSISTLTLALALLLGLGACSDAQNAPPQAADASDDTAPPQDISEPEDAPNDTAPPQDTVDPQDTGDEDLSPPDADEPDTDLPDAPDGPEDTLEDVPDEPEDVEQDAAEDAQDPEDTPEGDADEFEDAQDNDVPTQDASEDTQPDLPDEPLEPVVVRADDGRCPDETPPTPPTPVEDCQPASLTDPSAFVDCPAGSGGFGRWIVDEHGLPAYDYTADQAYDERAQWLTSEDRPRRDHWFQLGNDRMVATASNDGFVQFMHRDRGPTWLNRIDLPEGRTGGGYSYIAEDDQLWATAHRLRPCGAVTERQFGVGYARYDTTFRQLRVRHTISAPFGDWPFVLDEVTLTNLSNQTRTLRHYEFWDVNRHQLRFVLARSGLIGPEERDLQDDERAELAADFELRAVNHDHGASIRHVYTSGLPRPDINTPSSVDYHPSDITLARLLPSAQDTPVRIHTDRAAFFGQGSVHQPDAAALGTDPQPLAPTGAVPQGGLLVDEVPVTLAPGQSVTLRYAYGTLPQGTELQDVQTWADPQQDLQAELAAAWSPHLPRVATVTHPFLHRESAWHAAQLMQASLYESYFRAHAITQGSTYLYEHGFDGVGRDFAISAVPMIYTHPHLARESLRTIMRTTHGQDDQISYLVEGFGVLGDAQILGQPSDLDLFFLWTLTEYLNATGDTDFLEDTNPFWPRNVDAQATTYDHARRALIHLIDDIGTGPRGLVRLRTGDWNDIIVSEAPDPAFARNSGESVFNSQMALWIVPRALAFIEPRDPALANRARTWLQGVRQATEAQWTGQWYRRAWVGPNLPVGQDDLQLEGQLWALIDSQPNPDQRAAVTQNILDILDQPSPTGALRLENELTWHVLTGLLTWGYSQHNPTAAWAALGRHTMTAYARQNPNLWYGIWSGPDALSPLGFTWQSLFSAMTDFPVMNSNQHAAPLLATLRVAGLEPAPNGDGLRIAPATFEEPVAVKTLLIDFSVAIDGVRGTYHAQNDGTTALYIKLPGPQAVATLDGQPVPVDPQSQDVRLELNFSAGQSLEFAVVVP